MKKKLNDYTDRKYNVAWLKAKLQEALDNLEYFDDEDEIDIAQNTYWVGPNFISFGSIGFVDLENPVKEKEEEEEEFEDSIPEKDQEFIYSVEGMINGKVFQHKHEDLQVAKKDFDRTSEKIKEIDNSYVELWNIQEDKLLTMFDPRTSMVTDSKDKSTYQVLVMHQDYHETLHFITASNIKELEYKIGKIDPFFIDYEIVTKEEGLVTDGKSQLETALKMEEDTIAQYQQFARIAGDGDNPEKQLWDHLIEEEQEHAEELKKAMEGNFTEINDKNIFGGPSINHTDYVLHNVIEWKRSYSPKNLKNIDEVAKACERYDNSYLAKEYKKVIIENDLMKNYIKDADTTKFQQSVDGVAKLLRKAKLQENVSFAEGDQTYKTVLVETPKDKFNDILETLKEEYEIDSHNGKNRIFVKIKDSDEVKITMKSPEQKMIEEERDMTFSDRINDCLVDGGMDYKSYRITNEGDYFYVDFDDRKEDAAKAYEILSNNLFKCSFVEDEGFFFISIIRR